MDSQCPTSAIVFEAGGPLSARSGLHGDIPSPPFSCEDIFSEIGNKVTKPQPSVSATEPCTQELLLNANDLQVLQKELCLSLPELLGRLSSVENLHMFNQQDLKKIIHFLRLKYKRTILVIGKKDALIHRIAGIIYATKEANKDTVCAVSSFPCRIAGDTELSDREPCRDLNQLIHEPAYDSARQLLWSLHEILASKPFGLGVCNSNAVALTIPLTPATVQSLRTGHRLHCRLFSRSSQQDLWWSPSLTLTVAGRPVPSPRHSKAPPPAAGAVGGIPLDLTEHIVKYVATQTSTARGPGAPPMPCDSDVTHTSSDGVMASAVLLRLVYPHDHLMALQGGVLSVELVRQRTSSELQNMCQPLIRSNDENDDVVVVESFVSGLCPLSLVAMTCPVRGRHCLHEQCYELQAYVQLCCQQGQWLCPICRQDVPFEKLVMDCAFKDLIENAPLGHVSDLERLVYRPMA